MIVTALILLFFCCFAALWLIRWTQVAEALPEISPYKELPIPDPPPRVSVIIPVRNEETNIRDCMESLLRQDYPNLEIIVVDDGSEDRTPEILNGFSAKERAGEFHQGGAGPRLKVIQGRPCPPDWMGKNHALDQGYAAAKGDFLLFLDADTRACPALVEKTVGFAINSDTGLLTLLPSCEFQCFWDSVVNTLILYAAPFQNIEGFNDPADPQGNANGPFMLFRRDVYERIGGHKAIKAEVVEDLVISRKVKEHRFRLTWAIAPGLLTSRPYPSLADLRRGWGKVLFRCMEMDRTLIKYYLFLPVLMLAYFLFPWAALILTGIPGIVPWPFAARLALGCLALTQILTTVAGYRFLEILFQLRPSYPWAHPLGAVALAWVQWEACYRLLSGRKAVWKGREYREDSN